MITTTEIALMVFACVFGSALLGMFLRLRIPEHHLSDDAKDVVKLGMGVIATMTALVLGLMIATAKSSYDAQADALKHTAAKLLLLDRLLSHYGPEAKEAREVLRRTVASRVEEVWPEGRPGRAGFEPPGAAGAERGFEDRILGLSPQNEAQRWLQAQALRVSRDIMETRWLLVGSLDRSIPVHFLVVVVFWLMIIFGSFGLFAPRNATVVAVLFVCALSVAGAIFLVLEMDQPFEGLLKVSSAPLRYAVSRLGQ